MIRLAASVAVSLLANAIALIVATLFLSEMTLDGPGFIIAVVIYTATAALIEPLVRQIAVKNMPAILGSTALVATLVSLIVTTILGDGLRISGLVTWVLAVVIVWLVALVACLLLPLVIFKKILREASNGN
ncbi:MAG: hypothetical protein V9F03_10255 [Microthrixaceae bacterium]